MQKEGLGLSQSVLEELKDNLNIIVNCAGTVDFEVRLDIQTDVNVRGPLLLMKLAAQCSRFDAFLQVSTLFAHSDRIGFIDERAFKSSHDWSREYDRILSLNPADILK